MIFLSRQRRSTRLLPLAPVSGTDVNGFIRFRPRSGMFSRGRFPESKIGTALPGEARKGGGEKGKMKKFCTRARARYIYRQNVHGTKRRKSMTRLATAKFARRSALAPRIYIRYFCEIGFASGADQARPQRRRKVGQVGCRSE